MRLRERFEYSGEAGLSVDWPCWKAPSPGISYDNRPVSGSSTVFWASLPNYLSLPSIACDAVAPSAELANPKTNNQAPLQTSRLVNSSALQWNSKKSSHNDD